MRRKWPPVSRLFAALAVIFAAATFMVIHTYEQRVHALAPAAGNPVFVIVAAQDLARETTLQASMLNQLRYPSAFAPPGAIGHPAQAVGRTLLAPIAAGEPVTRTRLGPARAGPVASLVPTGMEAVAVQTSLPAGAIVTGDRVTVVATFGGGHPHTELTASGIEVLAILSPSTDSQAPPVPGVTDIGAGGSSSSGQTLMLLVDPDQASDLAYARAFATLEVVIDGHP